MSYKFSGNQSRVTGKFESFDYKINTPLKILEDGNRIWKVNDVSISKNKNYEVDFLKNPQNFITLLQEEDEVLDFSEAALKLEETELIIEEGGNHSFEGIERYFRKINSFFYN